MSGMTEQKAHDLYLAGNIDATARDYWIEQARLRGDGEKGQAVAHVVRVYPPNAVVATEGTHRLNPGDALYTRPQPVAGDAVRALRDAIEAHGDWDDGCFYYNGVSAPELQEPLRALAAALSTQPAPSDFDALYAAADEGKQAAKGVCRYWFDAGRALPAPSEQVAASVAVPDEDSLWWLSDSASTLAEAGNTEHAEKLRQLHALLDPLSNAAPVAPEREG